MSASLAPRELEYVTAAAHGKSDKEIAREMNCGIGGVHSTSRRARFKLHAKNRTELVVNALRAGFIELCLILCIVTQNGFLDLAGDTDTERNQPRGPRSSQRSNQRTGRNGRTNRTRFLRMRMRNKQDLTDLIAEIGSEVYQSYDLPQAANEQTAQEHTA